jgi:hypothetical protein
VLCSLTLVPLRWAQHIRSYPSLHIGEEEGGLFLRDLALQFSIIQGKLSHEVRQRDLTGQMNARAARLIEAVRKEESRADATSLFLPW